MGHRFKFVALAALALLAGCNQKPTEATGTDPQRVANGVGKYCDNGRAVYVYFSNGIAVVPNAEECPALPGKHAVLGGHGG